jgi:vancomycin resistance protein VanW
MNPLFYKISTKKEILKRHIQDLFSGDSFPKDRRRTSLPNLVSSHTTHLIKRGPGINPKHQHNKADNIALASSKLQGLLIRPGEVFSFWKAIGKITKGRGYKEGRIINRKKLTSGIGGGLCNLANSLHNLILRSPMIVTEFHQHSDALAPDQGQRVPFTSGTSVSYNHVDYRFKNSSNQIVQLQAWREGETLRAELRSEKAFPWIYEIREEDHRFEKIQDKYFRLSKIYRLTLNRSTAETLAKDLILDNRSEVMYDYNLIPQDQIRASDESPSNYSCGS